jgi:hypothetical protein
LESHRACNFFQGSWEANLLRWVKVESGFSDRFSGLPVDEDQFCQAVGIDPPAENGTKQAVLVLEPDAEG